MCVCMRTLVHVFYLNSSVAIAFLIMLSKDRESGGRVEVLQEKYIVTHLQEKLFWPWTGYSFLCLP